MNLSLEPHKKVRQILHAYRLKNTPPPINLNPVKLLDTNINTGNTEDSNMLITPEVYTMSKIQT